MNHPPNLALTVPLNCLTCIPTLRYHFKQEKQIKAVRGVNQYLRQTFHALAQSSACLDLDRRSVSVSVDGRSETAPLELRRSKTDRYRGSIKEYRRKP
ncbi:hypothetical protein RRG08_020114 [Elysia crispata]|uniref:Uncharacterized protein n=1 Tax=Elysia crispata TaxID=231223 RepID=A0AAE1A4S6_9GAST|nr:hypothetical protein RRG08_020114 [Elysia crispata]